MRQWFIIDWCTTQTIEENQVIKILDQQGPVFECPEDLVLSSHAYECINEPYELSFVDSVYDCSMYDSSYQILLRCMSHHLCGLWRDWEQRLEELIVVPDKRLTM